MSFEKHSWRNVQPKLDQYVIVLMRDDDVAIHPISLDLEYVDDQRWHVKLCRTVAQSIAIWRWRLNVR